MVLLVNINVCSVSGFQLVANVGKIDSEPQSCIVFIVLYSHSRFLENSNFSIVHLLCASVFMSVFVSCTKCVQLINYTLSVSQPDGL